MLFKEVIVVVMAVFVLTGSNGSATIDSSSCYDSIVVLSIRNCGENGENGRYYHIH